MDYINYVNQRVEDPATRSRIHENIVSIKQMYGDDWVPNFINNFHWLLPGLREAIEINVKKGKIDTTKRFGEYTCHKEASERYKNQNLDSFLREIDETVESLGISPDELAAKVANDIEENSRIASDEIFMVMIELMSKGYFRHDLSK